MGRQTIWAHWLLNYKVSVPDNIKVPKPPKTVRLRIPEEVRQGRLNWLWFLHNLIAGAEKTANDAICALYIIQSLGLAEIADDFKPEGITWVDSKKLQGLLYVLERKVLSVFKGKVVKKSYPFQLGRIFKDLSQRGLWKAALSIAYKGNDKVKWWTAKIGEDDPEMDKKVAESTLKLIEKRVAHFKKKFKIS